MTWLEFASATIGQLVWPLLIVVLVLVLKEPIKKLIDSPRLARLKAGPTGVEVEFKEELRDAEKQLLEAGHDKQIEPSLADDTIARDFLTEMNRLAAVSPRAVVMETHARLEKLLRESVDVNGARSVPFINMRALTRAAVEQGVLTPPESSVLYELSYLRNRVAHGADDEVITSETALRYAEIAAQVAIAIRLSQGKTIADGPPL